MSEWQTIESAPKTGARFLATWGKEPFICNWGNLFVRGVDMRDKFGWVNSHGQAGNTVNPTHWMPFPAPPAA